MSTIDPQGNVIWITREGQTGQEIASYGQDEAGDYWERLVDTVEGTTVINRLARRGENVGEWEPWRRVPDAASRRGSVTPPPPRTQAIK